MHWLLGVLTSTCVLGYGWAGQRNDPVGVVYRTPTGNPFRYLSEPTFPLNGGSPSQQSHAICRAHVRVHQGTLGLADVFRRSLHWGRTEQDIACRSATTIVPAGSVGLHYSREFVLASLDGPVTPGSSCQPRMSGRPIMMVRALTVAQPGCCSHVAHPTQAHHLLLSHRVVAPQQAEESWPGAELLRPLRTTPAAAVHTAATQ